MRIKRDYFEASTGINAMIIFVAIILVASIVMASFILTIQKLSEVAEENAEETKKEFSGTISIIGAWLGPQYDCDGDYALRDSGSESFDDKCIFLLFTLAPGSNPIYEYDVHWVINCDGNNDFTSLTGTFDGYGAGGAVSGDFNIDDDGDGVKDYLVGCCAYYPRFRDNGETKNIDGSDKLMDADGDGFVDDDDDILLPDKQYMIYLKIASDVNDNRRMENGVIGNWPFPAGGFPLRDCSPTFVDEEYLNLFIVVDGGGTTYDTIELVENWVEGERVI